MKIILPILILIMTSCNTATKIVSKMKVSTEPFKRSEYKISDDKNAEATVTQTLGLFYNNKDFKNKKGIIKMNNGNLKIANFNFNVSGLILASALSIGSGFILSNIDYKAGKYRRHSSMTNNPSTWVEFMPYSIAYPCGLIIGFGINALIAPAPYRKAENIATYKLISDNKFDYIINPKFEIINKNDIFKKTSTVRITAKGINIIPDK